MRKNQFAKQDEPYELPYHSRGTAQHPRNRPSRPGYQVFRRPHQAHNVFVVELV